MTDEHNSGVALRFVRKNLKLTQVQLGEKLSINAKTVFRYEKGIDPVPLSVARKVLDLILDVPGMKSDVHWWNGYLQYVLRTKTGLDTPEPIVLRGRKLDTRAAEVLGSALELWGVFHPQMNPTEELIHSRLSHLLNELAEMVIPQQEIRCPICGQSDRTHRFVIYEGQNKPVDMFSCDRCKQGGRIEKEKRTDGTTETKTGKR